MTHESCPLRQLSNGDIGVNAYEARKTIFNRSVFRLNCRHCPTGYVDYLASNSTAIPDDTSRYETAIEKVLGVNDCGIEKSK